MLNLPLDKIASHDPTWWAQPVATVIAGLLALAGAAVAFQAVQREIKSADNQQAKNRAHDRTLARRAERLAVLTDASELAHKLQSQAGRVRAIKENDQAMELDPELSADRINEVRRDDHRLEAGLMARKLKLHGLSGASIALQTLQAESFAVVYDMWRVGDEWTIDARESAVVATLQAALDADET
jgi:hypothetical protein